MSNNNDIVIKNLELINTCIKYQTKGYAQYKDDLRSEIILQLLEMDPIKLNKILIDNALNAYITKIIFYSLKTKNSRFYRMFIDPQRRAKDIGNFDFVDEED